MFPNAPGTNREASLAVTDSILTLIRTCKEIVRSLDVSRNTVRKYV